MGPTRTPSPTPRGSSTRRRPPRPAAPASSSSPSTAIDSTTRGGLRPHPALAGQGAGQRHPPVYVRGQDAAGNWGDLFAAELTVDKTAPVLGALTASPNPTNGAATLTLSATVKDASSRRGRVLVRHRDPGGGRLTRAPESNVSEKIAFGGFTVTVVLAALLQLPARSCTRRLTCREPTGSRPAAPSPRCSCRPRLTGTRVAFPHPGRCCRARTRRPRRPSRSPAP